MLNLDDTEVDQHLHPLAHRRQAHTEQFGEAPETGKLVVLPEGAEDDVTPQLICNLWREGAPGDRTKEGSLLPRSVHIT